MPSSLTKQQLLLQQQEEYHRAQKLARETQTRKESSCRYSKPLTNNFVDEDQSTQIESSFLNASGNVDPLNGTQKKDGKVVAGQQGYRTEKERSTDRHDRVDRDRDRF